MLIGEDGYNPDDALRNRSLGLSGTLFTAGEDRAITAWDTNRRKLAYSIQDAHPARIKAMRRPQIGNQKAQKLEEGLNTE
ncbi:hypothetical protein Bca52824_083711 [Brassica carinata]|uniref:Uncharacterized protein n=1 Tax=Brassica carinata TaxID=52824 RepID=A0A8X7TT23_BRACI|nr:hypothetical protein Bca52824_083711 [Brassica carinata]